MLFLSEQVKERCQCGSILRFLFNEVQRSGNAQSYLLITSMTYAKQRTSGALIKFPFDFQDVILFNLHKGNVRSCAIERKILLEPSK